MSPLYGKEDTALPYMPESPAPKIDLSPKVMSQGAEVERNRWEVHNRILLMSQYALFEALPDIQESKDGLDQEIEELLEEESQKSIA